MARRPPTPARPARPGVSGGRTERKAQTRRALLDAALALVERGGFAGLGLREVCREAGVVPGAFYRHFGNLDELGLALVEESFESLHAVLRAVREGGAAVGGTAAGDLVARSTDVLVRHVGAHRPHFRFIASERGGGVAVVRQAIRSEIRLFTSELETDLARVPELDDWPTGDLRVLADLIVQVMVAAVDDLLEVPDDRPDQAQAVAAHVRRQVRLILVGVAGWRPGA